jgi:hypothetical protein
MIFKSVDMHASFKKTMLIGKKRKEHELNSD